MNMRRLFSAADASSSAVAARSKNRWCCTRSMWPPDCSWLVSPVAPAASVDPAKPESVSPALVQLDPEPPPDIAPFVHVGLDERGELLGRAARRVHSLFGEAAPHFAEIERAAELLVQERDHRARRLRRSQHSPPADHLETRQPGLAD